MKVTFVYSDGPQVYNSSHWRSVIPYHAFNRTRRHSANLLGIAEFTAHPPIAEAQCADADVIVIQRGAMAPAFDVVEHWQQRGKIVLADLDDGYLQIEKTHPGWAFWNIGLERAENGQVVQLEHPPILELAEGLRRVQGLVSPNKLVLADWKEKVGVPGAFLPNYPDLRDYQARRTRSLADDGTTWVAWGGSASHLTSFTDSGIFYALARVLASRPTTRFVFIGSDQRILDAVPLREGQKQHFNWRPFGEWPKLLVNFDIGLIPLAGEFDARRSFLKPMECSLLGVPWIASKSPAYEGLEDYGVFVDNTPAAWADALTDLLTHGPDPNRLRRARKWAASLDIDDHVDTMATIYKGFGQ